MLMTMMPKTTLSGGSSCSILLGDSIEERALVDSEK